MNQVDSTGNHKLIRRPSSGVLSDTSENFEVWGFIHPTHRFCSGLIFPLGVDDPEVNGTGAQKMVRCSSINALHDTFETFEVWGSTLSGHRFWDWISICFTCWWVRVDRTGDHNQFKCHSISVVHDTYENFEDWGFTLMGHRLWIGLVFPLCVGEPEVDGTNDHKLVRCLSIGVVHDTYENSETWGFTVLGHRFWSD